MAKKNTDAPVTVENLQVELDKTKQELSEARLSHAARELANPRRLTELRRQIARLNTKITQTQYAANKEQS